MSRKFTVQQAVTEFFNDAEKEGTIYNDCREGKLPHVRMGKNRIVLDKATLQ